MGWNILSPSHLILNVDALITPFNGSHSKIQRAANKNQLEKLVKWFAKLCWFDLCVKLDLVRLKSANYSVLIRMQIISQSCQSNRILC